MPCSHTNPAAGSDDDVDRIKDDHPAAIAEVVERVRCRLDTAMHTNVPGFYPLLDDEELEAFRARKQPNPYLIDTNYKASLVCWPAVGAAACCLGVCVWRSLAAAWVFGAAAVFGARALPACCWC